MPFRSRWWASIETSAPCRRSSRPTFEDCLPSARDHSSESHHSRACTRSSRTFWHDNRDSPRYRPASAPVGGSLTQFHSWFADRRPTTELVEEGTKKNRGMV